MGEAMKPELAAEFPQRTIASADLAPPLHSYGVLCYEAYTVAGDRAPTGSIFPQTRQATGHVTYLQSPQVNGTRCGVGTLSPLRSRCL